MVTADRPDLARRAISCFEHQTHPELELVIVDDGDVDYSSMIEASPARHRIRYVRLTDGPRRNLGSLRNLAIDAAKGNWMIQWDDDDWYHPRRVEVQLEHAVRGDVGASALRWTLVEVADEDGTPLHFRSDCGIATPGSILFERTSNRYPDLRRNEDGIFMRDVRSLVGLAVLGPEHAHLMVRVHHGSNTWEREHFLRKISRTPHRRLRRMWAERIRGDITTMPAFRLSDDERRTVADLRSWTPHTHAAKRSVGR
jgi:glycosyltransferase involved in cell wall biosynthesis